MVKPIAFYLPQFHTIPENDMWWGKGFTEWTNVKKGRPMYLGHYQPIVPLNKNYYNLLENDTIKKQMNLARKHGIYGFCFYHYYTNGKLLLERPAEMVLENPYLNFPFCFAWANQSWTRAWNGKDGENQILLQQQYGNEEEWEKHFEYLLKFFLDDRYIKIDGRPVILIYMSKQIPRCNDMISLWRNLAKINGLNDLYVVSMETGYESDNIHKCFDAKVDYEPLRSLRETPQNIHDKVNYKKELLDKIGCYSAKVYSYDYMYKIMSERKYKEKTFLGAYPAWDNVARKDISGTIFKGSTPQKFEYYLAKQIERSIEMGNEFLFINAWNEWSEGAYLEPDNKYGYAYINAISRALKRANIMESSKAKK